MCVCARARTRFAAQNMPLLWCSVFQKLLYTCASNGSQTRDLSVRVTHVIHTLYRAAVLTSKLKFYAALLHLIP